MRISSRFGGSSDFWRGVWALLRGLGGCVLVAGATAWGASEEWRFTKTEHFEVLSSASEKKTKQLVVELEQFRASFIATFALRPAVEPRVTLVLFESDKRFTPFKPTYKGRVKDVSGFFIGGDDETMIAMNAGRDSSGEDSAAETIFHEYVHLLLHSRGLKLPTWLNEGMAELFSTFAVEDKMVEYGRPKQNYVDVLNFSALMPLANLFAVNETSPDYNEEDRAGMFYAQSWALTHFLVCGADRTNAARLARFLEAADASPAGPDAAFREAFGQDYKKMEADLRGYLQGGSYYKRRVAVPLADLAGKITVRRATDFERDMALLNLRWRVHKAGDTMLGALQLADKNPTEPGPQELLAMVAAAENDLTAALERWKKAAELNSQNPFVLMQAVRAKVIELGAGHDPDSQWPVPETEQLRQWIDRARQLNPRAEEAVELLALVEANAKEFRISAVNELQSRVSRLKDPNPVLLALAVIRWRVKDYATVRSILTAVLEATKARPDTKTMARLLLTRFEHERAQAAVAVVTPSLTNNDPSPKVATTSEGPSVPLPKKKQVPVVRRAVAVIPKLETAAARVLTPEESFRADRDYVNASRGEAEACYAVAAAHALGRRVIFDPEEALSWLRQAAEAGHAGAIDVRTRAGTDSEVALRLLREREGGLPALEDPPLNSELLAQIKTVEAAGGDAPPHPIYRARARYPETQRKARIAGDGTARLVIDETGCPRDVKVWGFSMPEFGQAAAASVRGWRFIPAIKDGKATRMTVDITLTFGADAVR